MFDIISFFNKFSKVLSQFCLRRILETSFYFWGCIVQCLVFCGLDCVKWIIRSKTLVLEFFGFSEDFQFSSFFQVFRKVFSQVGLDELFSWIGGYMSRQALFGIERQIGGVKVTRVVGVVLLFLQLVTCFLFFIWYFVFRETFMEGDFYGGRFFLIVS